MIWQLIDSSSVGGAERHIETISQSLRKRGHRVEIVLYADHGNKSWLKQLSVTGVPTRILDGTPIALIRALREEKPALLHTHGYKAGILGRFAARLARIPVVSTFHSGARGPFPVGLYEWLDEWTSLLSHNIAVSRPIKGRLPFPSALVLNFVPLPEAPPQIPLPRRVGFVGRLSEEKRPDIFCELARSAAPGLEWNVYGDGPLRAALEKEYGARVHFHGVIVDMTRVWSSLGLLVMPSRHEGLPFAVLEALAAGVPVIASRVGGLPEAVIDDISGWLFESGQLKDAQSRIAVWRTLDREAELELRRTCWLHARRNFGEEKWMPELLSIYKAAGLGDTQE